MRIEVHFLDTAGDGPKARLIEKRIFSGWTRAGAMRKVQRRGRQLMDEHGLPFVGMAVVKK